MGGELALLAMSGSPKVPFAPPLPDLSTPRFRLRDEIAFRPLGSRTREECLGEEYADGYGQT